MKATPNIEEFYHNIALLSMKFARMEYHLGEILSKFITDSFVISGILFENNVLAKNIELLKKINQYKGFETERLDKILKEINSIRGNRNLFVHGLWGNPYLEDDDIICVVSSFKLERTKGNIEKNWLSGKHRKVTLSELKKTTTKIDRIISEQENLLKLIEEEGAELRDHIY